MYKTSSSVQVKRGSVVTRWLKGLRTLAKTVFCCPFREGGLSAWGRCVLSSHAPPTSATPHMDSAAPAASVNTHTVLICHIAVLFSCLPVGVKGGWGVHCSGVFLLLLLHKVSDVSYMSFSFILELFILNTTVIHGKILRRTSGAAPCTNRKPCTVINW